MIANLRISYLSNSHFIWLICSDSDSYCCLIFSISYFICSTKYAIPRLLPTNFLSVFDHFMGLVLKGLNYHNIVTRQISAPQPISSTLSERQSSHLIKYESKGTSKILILQLFSELGNSTV